MVHTGCRQAKKYPVDSTHKGFVGLPTHFLPPEPLVKKQLPNLWGAETKATYLQKVSISPQGDAVRLTSYFEG